MGKEGMYEEKVRKLGYISTGQGGDNNILTRDQKSELKVRESEKIQEVEFLLENQTP